MTGTYVGGYPEDIELRPSAAKLLESMRDIGYSFETALADIIDNSVSAEARTIRIYNDVDARDEPFVAVVDDGRGMSSEMLTAAMRHGSRSPRETRTPGDLGRFGLGLKTASFSQCRILTVVSRVDGIAAARCWDLDHVVARDDWYLKVLTDEAIADLPGIELLGNTGTLVLWQGLDRLDASAASADALRDAMNDLFSRARAHLALTFHRFIAPDDGTDPVAILVNGNSLEALDPFGVRMQPRSESHVPERILSAQGEIAVQAFTLPHHSRITAEQLDNLSLGKSLRETQGLYIYREKRLIAGGSWAGLARQSELTKLIRVRVDVPTSMDSEWNVDVRKSIIRPPAIVRRRLRPLVDKMCESGRRPYSYRGQRQAAGPGFPLWHRITERGTIRYEINRSHPLVVAAAGSTSGDTQLLALLLGVEASLPLETMFSDYGHDPHKVTQSELDNDALRGLLAAFIEALEPRSNQLSHGALDRVLATYPFAGDKRVAPLIREMRNVVTDPLLGSA